MSKGYTVKECIEIVNCCYFVGSCHACPAHKATGYANIIRCAGPKEVGEALLSILEPLHNAQRMKEPTLFDVVQAVMEAEEPAESAEVSAEVVTGEAVSLSLNDTEVEDGCCNENPGQNLVSEDDAESDTAAAGS